ncbi:MAG: ATP-dependent DNA helicase, partial [Rhodospirillaceae bacterium]
MILIPPEPALVAGSRGALMLTPDGEVLSLSKGAAARRALAEHRPMFCHGPATAARLGIGVGDLRGYDLLTLFAFVHPARFCTPTPRGLAEVVGLRPPGSPEEAAATLPMAVGVLLRRLAGASEDRRRAARGPAFAMAQAGWAWGQPVLAALDPRGEIANAGGVRTTAPAQSLEVWKALPDISEHTPEASPGHEPVAPEEARQKLAELLGPQAEDRPQQADYATGVCAAFHPRDRRDNPNLVLAEAGTGTGKTLGYIAPAGLWADRNEGSVWISTYTRNLQRQLDLELDRLYDDPVEKSRRVVVRKGRENYLCLLNYQESLRGSGASLMGGQAVVALGLTARWIQATRDGDMVGGDFPGWLPDLIGREHSVALADRRGECIFSACEHYNRCFVERAVRRARRARLVVANHALVIVQAALGGLDDDTRPTRYVFDEGHHLFDAADSAFSAHLSGVETSELRRWLLGGEPDAGGG